MNQNARARVRARRLAARSGPGARVRPGKTVTPTGEGRRVAGSVRHPCLDDASSTDTDGSGIASSTGPWPEGERIAGSSRAISLAFGSTRNYWRGEARGGVCGDAWRRRSMRLADGGAACSASRFPTSATTTASSPACAASWRTRRAFWPTIGDGDSSSTRSTAAEILKVAADHFADTRILAAARQPLGLTRRGSGGCMAGRKEEMAHPMTLEDLDDIGPFFPPPPSSAGACRPSSCRGVARRRVQENGWTPTGPRTSSSCSASSAGTPSSASWSC